MTKREKYYFKQDGIFCPHITCPSRLTGDKSGMHLDLIYLYAEVGLYQAKNRQRTHFCKVVPLSPFSSVSPGLKDLQQPYSTLFISKEPLKHFLGLRKPPAKMKQGSLVRMPLTLVIMALTLVIIRKKTPNFGVQWGESSLHW